jgi:putative transposase
MPNYRRDLTQGATYFFTLTLADRRTPLLVDAIGKLRSAYLQTAKALPFETLAICILPDHLHAVWTLPDGDHAYAQRWASIKSGFSRQLPARPRLSASQRLKREKGIWQRRFWEHRIRDEHDLIRHVDYIHNNPVKHGLVTHVHDWPYSSFHRYVKDGLLPADWGSASNTTGTFGE